MKSAALVAVFLYVAEASIVSHLGLQRRSTRGCQGYIERCVEPLMPYEHVFNNMGSPSEINGPLLDRLCTDLPGVMACTGNVLSLCGSAELAEHVRAMTLIVNYVCSPDGRAVVLEMTRSPCASNVALSSRLQGVFQDCMQGFQMEMAMLAMEAMEADIENPSAHICPLLQELKVCAVDGTTNLCGNAFGTFLNHIWDIAMENQLAGANINCTVTARRARSIVSNAVHFLGARK